MGLDELPPDLMMSKYSLPSKLNVLCVPLGLLQDAL